MGLIIGKTGIPMFKVGYPTVSDKYNITGGTLAGETAVNFGDLVKFSSIKGYYEAITGAITLADIAGFVLATNVKLATEWPGTDESVKVLPGEAFNLVLPGSYLAIELDSTAVEDDVKANAQVYAIPATGKCTTVATSNLALPGVVFTGMVEKHGTKLVAEIYVK
jgi:hypothetical protein